MPAEYWWRSWHGAPMDHKWPVIAARAGVPTGVVSAIAWALLDYASQADERGSVVGFDVETYACYSGFPEDQIAAVIQAMTDKGIIVDGHLANWEKRQPKSERETLRKAEYRQRIQQEELSRDVPDCPTMSQDVPPSPIDTDADTDADTERSKESLATSASTPAGTPEPPPPPEEAAPKKAPRKKAEPREPTEAELARDELEAFFCEYTCIPPPRRTSAADFKATQRLWWNPINRILALVDGNPGQGMTLVKQAVDTLRADGMTVATPNSIEATATAYYGKVMSKGTRTNGRH